MIYRDHTHFLHLQIDTPQSEVTGSVLANKMRIVSQIVSTERKGKKQVKNFSGFVHYYVW